MLNIFNLKFLLLFVGLGLACCAAYYSVVGISTLFAGAMLSAGIMAIFIELGKIVSVCFLYRYWNECQKFLKIYLSIALLIITMITTCGISSVLLSAYQKSSLEFKANQEKITTIESQKPFYTNLIAQSDARIKTLSDARVVQEARLSEAMTNAFLSRNPLQLKQLQEQTISLINQANEDIKTESGQIRTNQAKIMSINDEVNTMKFSSAGKKDIRTFQFVAQEFGTTLDKVAKWFIFTLIFVFDPLAIALILAYNIAVFKKIDEKSINPQPEPPKEIIDVEKKTLVNPPITLPPETINKIVSQIISENTSSIEPLPQVIEKIEDPLPPSKPAEAMDPFYRRMFKM